MRYNTLKTASTLAATVQQCLTLALTQRCQWAIEIEAQRRRTGQQAVRWRRLERPAIVDCQGPWRRESWRFSRSNSGRNRTSLPCQCTLDTPRDDC